MGIKGRRELHIPDLIGEGGRRRGEGVTYWSLKELITEDKHSGVLIRGMRAKRTCWIRVEAPQPQHGKNTPADNFMAHTKGQTRVFWMLSHSEPEVIRSSQVIIHKHIISRWHVMILLVISWPNFANSEPWLSPENYSQKSRLHCLSCGKFMQKTSD